MAALERIAAGLALAVLIIGVGVIALATPGLTRVLVVWSDAPALSGLSPDEATQAAEDVRSYVTGASEDPLPQEIAGRLAFDADAVGHLDDVADVLSFNRMAIAIAAGFAAGWVSLNLARRRREELVVGLFNGAVIVVAVVVSALLLGLVDFDTLFTGFHGLFFDPGTWQFPSDSLLIQLFPLRFWVAMAALWGLLSLVGAALLYTASRSLRTDQDEPSLEVG